MLSRRNREMKIKVSLNIGYATAVRRGEIEIDDKEWAELDADEKWEIANEWAQNYIAIDYEEPNHG
jgi:hypothetical protein